MLPLYMDEDGETHIDVRRVRPDLRITEVYLTPGAQAYPPAVEAVLAADLVVIGPGDLYTSVIPNLLVEGVPQAIRNSAGKVAYVCNLMTKRGETDGYKASDFLREVQRYLGGDEAVDVMLVNQEPAPQEILEEYGQEGSYPVEADVAGCAYMVTQVICKDFATAGTLWRHDAMALAEAVIGLTG
ncbi:MAG: hypothetical protein A2Z04_01595 [Chloroflexi bacterium RBG_16_57_9]|nr:MAG: hypothetical protein A2Z04_01595 [Chloroflexi bacterium RBG_16_57_9]